METGGIGEKGASTNFAITHVKVSDRFASHRAAPPRLDVMRCEKRGRAFACNFLSSHAFGNLVHTLTACMVWCSGVARIFYWGEGAEGFFNNKIIFYER